MDVVEGLDTTPARPHGNGRDGRQKSGLLQYPAREALLHRTRGRSGGVNPLPDCKRQKTRIPRLSEVLTAETPTNRVGGTFTLRGTGGRYLTLVEGDVEGVPEYSGGRGRGPDGVS